MKTILLSAGLLEPEEVVTVSSSGLLEPAEVVSFLSSGTPRNPKRFVE